MMGETQPVAEPVSCDNGEHYVWGGNCQGWRLVQNAGLSVIEESMPPGSAEQIHRHQVAQQFFYVLFGEAVMEFAGYKVAIAAGKGLSVNPGIPHRIRNQSTNDVRFLVISQPSTKNGDRETLAAWPEK